MRMYHIQIQPQPPPPLLETINSSIILWVEKYGILHIFTLYGNARTW